VLLSVSVRLFENPGMKHAAMLWRLVWLLPASFFFMVFLGNNYIFSENIGDTGFIVIRVLLYLALTLACYLLDISLRQLSENITLKERAGMTERQLYLQLEQYARLAENEELAKRSRHDMRHHLAVMLGYSKSGEGEKLSVGLLSSVRAICEKHGGLMRVEINGETWRSSALVNMEEE